MFVRNTRDTMCLMFPCCLTNISKLGNIEQKYIKTYCKLNKRKGSSEYTCGLKKYIIKLVFAAKNNN